MFDVISYLGTGRGAKGRVVLRAGLGASLVMKGKQKFIY